MNEIQNEWKFGFKFWISAIVVGLSTWLIYQLIPIISMLVISFLLVYTILPLVNFLVRIKIPYTVSAISAFLFILTAIGLFMYILIPGMIKEISQFMNYVSTDLIPFINRTTGEIEKMETRYNLQVSFASFVEQIPTHMQSILISLSSFSVALFAGIGSFVVVIFIIFFMLLYAKDAKHSLDMIFPSKYRENVQHVTSVINSKVGAYIRGSLVRCLVVGILTGVILAIVGQPFSIVLGVLAGVLNLIPYIGPVVAAVPAVLISFAPDTPHFLLVTGIYFFVQGIDSFVLIPFLLGKAVDLSPLTIIIMVFASAQVAGITGIILAIPVAAIVKVLFYHYYVQKLDNADLLAKNEADATERKDNIIINTIMRGKKYL